jgi:hypothetical protein
MKKKKSTKVAKLADKKKVSIEERKKQLESELDETMGLIGGLNKRLEEAVAMANHIKGKIALIEEIENGSRS